MPRSTTANTVQGADVECQTATLSTVVWATSQAPLSTSDRWWPLDRTIVQDGETPREAKAPVPVATTPGR